MTIFDLDLRHPHHHSDEETEYFADLTAEDVLSKFNTMNWKQLQILMLQMRGGKASFTATDNTSNQTVKISLIELPNTDALAFKFESDIDVNVEQKNLFGLLKYNVAVDVQFQHLSLGETRDLLDAFIQSKLDVIKNRFLESHSKTTSKV